MIVDSWTCCLHRDDQVIKCLQVMRWLPWRLGELLPMVTQSFWTSILHDFTIYNTYNYYTSILVDSSRKCTFFSLGQNVGPKSFTNLQVRKNSRFKRLGDDLMADVKVSLAEAAGGSCLADVDAGSGEVVESNTVYIYILYKQL